MKLGVCSQYNTCPGRMYPVGRYIFFWDCRCRLMKYWICRQLFARYWYKRIAESKKKGAEAPFQFTIMWLPCACFRMHFGSSTGFGMRWSKLYATFRTCSLVFQPLLPPRTIHTPFTTEFIPNTTSYERQKVYSGKADN